MSIIDIIVLCVFFALNVAAIITFNVTTKEIELKQRLFVSFMFIPAGCIYWVVLAFNSIRYLAANKKNKN